MAPELEHPLSALRRRLRFSLQTLLIGFSLLSVVFAFGRQSFQHGLMAGCIILLGTCWYYEPAQAPPRDDPFPLALFVWTGIKSVFGSLLLAAAVIFLSEPFEPALDWFVARAIVPFVDPQMRQGAFEALLGRIQLVLCAGAVGAMLILIASRPFNFAARFAAPLGVVVIFVFQLQEIVRLPPNDSMVFVFLMSGITIGAFVCGWLGDWLREKRWLWHLAKQRTDVLHASPSEIVS